MKQISDTTTGITLIIAIVITVGGTFLSLQKLSAIKKEEVSGMATTGDGRLNLSIIKGAAILIRSNVDFGSSTLGGVSASIDTDNSDNFADFRNCSDTDEGTYSGGAWQYDCRGIHIENDGNAWVNLTLQAQSNTTAFFTGNPAQAEFWFMTEQGNLSGSELVSCYNGSQALNNTPTNWTDIPTTATLICGNFSRSRGNNSITVEFKLSIPSNEPVGYKNNTFIFTAAVNEP